ncbi:MAG: Tfp pilus assembly protein PilF [Maribacter sp.]|jgi:Tfp pilus assembly protein PilF
MSQKKKKKAKQQKDKSVTKKKPMSIGFDKFHLLLGGIIFGLAFLLYANTLGHEYALDDNSVVTDSHIVRGGISNLGEIFTTRYREGSFGESSTMYRPMSIAMFAIEWTIAKDTPQISHFVNVLLYAMTCMLMFLTFRNILHRYSIWIPFLAMLLFAAHPLHTEIVANIKSRDEILVLFFSILALFNAWKYAEEGEQSKHLIYSCLSLVGALFSKENAVIFVALIPLTLYFFSKLSLKKIFVLFGIYLIPTIVYLLARISVLGSIFPEKISTNKIDNFLTAESASFIEQKATAMWVMGKYLLLLVYPNPLICDYNYNYIPITTLSNPLVFLSLLAHIGLLGFALMTLKTKKFLSYAILFYLINMFLYSNLLLVIGAGLGERFLYISSFGFCLAVAYFLAKYLGGGTELEENPKDMASMFTNKTPLLAVTGIILVLAAYQTITRNVDWFNSYSLYQSDIQKAPESARLNGYIGTEYLKLGKKTQDLAEQKEYYDKAVEVYSRAVEIHPEYTEAIGQLGLSYFRRGEFAEASKWYEKAIADPGCKGSIYSNYGYLFFNEALAKQRAGDQPNFEYMINKAKEMYEKALKREPNYSDGYMNMGSTYGVMGEHTLAAENLEKALEYAKEEQLSTIYGNLVNAYTYLGRTADAKRAQENQLKYKNN